LYTLASVTPREIIKTKPKFDSSGKEVRPSDSFIVISPQLVQQNGELCVCVGITSHETEGQFLIPLRRRDVEDGELEEEGQIDYRRIITLYKKQVLETTGLKITEKLYEEIIKMIHKDIIIKST